jgi:hypothetical protein
MAEEDKSTISSLGSVGASISGNRKLILENGRIENWKATLARDAAAKTVLNGGFSGEDVVKSPHIERMLNAYMVASVESYFCVRLRTVGRLGCRVLVTWKAPLPP